MKLRRYGDDARFRGRVDELRRQRVTVTTTRLMHLADSALAALEELLTSDNEGVRFRAAQAVLTMGRRHHREYAIELDLAARAQTMEALFEGVAEKLK